MYTKVLTLVFGMALTATAVANEDYPCLIEPDQTVELGSPIVGVVEKITVERGDDVKKGQVIAELQGDVETRSVALARSRASDSAAIQSAIAAAEHSQREHHRAQLMYSRKLVTQQFLDKAATEAAIAKSNLEQVRNQQSQAKKELRLAQSRLDRSRIVSPIDGIITERYVSIGQRVQNQPLVKIASVRPLRVEVIVPAEQFSQFEKGDILTVTPQIKNIGPQEATVSIIDPVIDPASNSFRITLNLPNPEGAIPAGARCEVDLPGAPTRKDMLSAQSEKSIR